MSTSLEDAAFKVHQNASVQEVRDEFPKYFEALNRHPRLLVGQEVPAIGREGMELLKDSADAREWQDAVKQILAQEVQDRAERRMEEDRDTLTTIHSSIELFQNNSDMVPGTRQFDKELADAFVIIAKPYEVRIDGKLHGYSIPVQPLIEQVRGQLKSRRAARAAATPKTPAPSTPRRGRPPGSTSTPPASRPQAGVTSKAGEASEGSDFSTLFGTIGLPDFRI